MRTRKNKRTVQPAQQRPGCLAQQVLAQIMRPRLELAGLLLVGGERIAIEFPERSGPAFMAEFVD